ncbi:MAG TPA: bifunctional DNA-binding transcriptional regulator/O6-methylguanine-DNA methyltransferase Ada [Anaeromyxobacter sp.]|nr:bifunctional DNA-binding transcriptional regulator/O6-methylguanine-DNA methyltransferase Ada [Anaeromyxobacter sp.]
MTLAPERSRSDQAAWRAVLRRDRSADGAFVYAVRTTGIYCRPSCPSRRPRRENVTFFPSPAEAERGGFRPCARCGPASRLAAERAVARAAAFLEERPEERVTLPALAAEVGLSPSHLQRTFRRVLGVSPRAFQDARRLARFKGLVRRGEPVGSAGYGAGYGSSRGLYESARAGLGMTPAAYRKGGEREAIRFGIVGTGLGRLLVAATGRGVCSVALGDSDAALEHELRGEFPRAGLERDDPGVARWTRAVVGRLEGAPGEELPLDLRGTAFQLRVWSALRQIPFGETRSYAAVARAVAAPRAARAVARACAANRVALLVPCHRVVRGGGELGGYRWGVERKRRLLEAEAAPAGVPARARPGLR